MKSPLRRLRIYFKCAAVKAAVRLKGLVDKIGTHITQVNGEFA